MKGICFKEPLFNATIEGLKTQTRRIIKPQPIYSELTGVNWRGATYGIGLKGNPEEAYRNFSNSVGGKYKVGEVVYLKEPYVITGMTFEYKYLHENKTDIDCIERNGGYKNKLFMPELAARYFIKITTVRAERLQDISDEDCFREGIMDEDFGGMQCVAYGLSEGIYFTELGGTPIKAYAALLDKINGRGTWNNNPFVWVYDYELVNE